MVGQGRALRTQLERGRDRWRHMVSCLRYSVFVSPLAVVLAGCSGTHPDSRDTEDAQSTATVKEELHLSAIPRSPSPPPLRSPGSRPPVPSSAAALPSSLSTSIRSRCTVVSPPSFRLRASTPSATQVSSHLLPSGGRSSLPNSHRIRSATTP